MSICPQSTTTTSMTLSTHQLIEKPAVAFLVCLLDLVLELLVLGGSCVLSQFGSDSFWVFGLPARWVAFEESSFEFKHVRTVATST